MEIEEKFLPIGTVVLLKEGTKEVMITSYCIIPNGDIYDKSGKIEGANQMYDYGACLYPEGEFNSKQVIAFNHDQIQRICFKGYETEMQKELSEKVKEGLKELERKKAQESQA